MLAAHGFDRFVEKICEPYYAADHKRNADLLFQLVNLRYEKKSIVFTTNLAFRDWPTIFPNATCATALIDRIVHHAEIVVVEGDSYRRREAEAEIKSRRQARSAGYEKAHFLRGANSTYREGDRTYFAVLELEADGQPCTLSEIDGANYCVPIHGASVLCKGTTCDGADLAVLPHHNCPSSFVSAVVTSSVGASCANETALLSVGTRVEDSTAYSGYPFPGEACRAFPAVATLYRAERVVAADVLPSLDVTLQGSDRLRARYPVGTDGDVLTRTNASFFDTERDADCVPHWAAGEWRCLPRTAPFFFRLYVDDAGQSPVDVAEVPAGADLAYGVGPGGHLHELGAPVTPQDSLWVQDLSGTCVVFTPGCARLARLGDRVDRTMFPRLAPFPR